MVNMSIRLTAEIKEMLKRDVLKNRMVFAHCAKGKLLVSDCLTGSLTVTLASIKGNVAESTSIFIPASAKVHAAIKPVLDEKPSWEK